MTLPGLHVSGNQILDASGAVVRLRGVNMYSEASCASSYVPYGLAHDSIQLAYIKSWGCNVIRTFIDGDCWSSTGGAVYAGTPYQNAVIAWVQLCLANNVYVILTYGGIAAEVGMASASTTTVWQQWLALFGDDTRVILDLYNEPASAGGNTLTWSIWKNGGAYNGFTSVGMQELVTAVRAAGSTSICMLGGLSWSSDLTSWIANIPTDSMNNLAASFHMYSGTFDQFDLGNTYIQLVKTVAASYPVIAGECGGQMTSTLLSGQWTARFCQFMESIGGHYLPFAWNADTLVDRLYSGIPSQTGRWFHDYLHAVTSGGSLGSLGTRLPVTGAQF